MVWLGYLGLLAMLALDPGKHRGGEREIQNAGRVLNGRVLGEDGVVAMIERTLDRTQRASSSSETANESG